MYKSPPDFIAFEYAEATHAALVTKRAELARSLEAVLPKLGKDFVTHFANTLAYEGDLYREITPPTNSIWMLDSWKENDIRITDRDLVSAAFSNKIINLKDWLLQRVPQWTRLNDSKILKEAASVYMRESERLAGLSGEAAVQEWELKDSIQTGRESHMFDSLKLSLDKQSKGNYGIIIVGAAHLLDVPGSLFALCRALELPTERRWPHEQ